MGLIFTQTDSASVTCGAIQACAANATASNTLAKLAAVSGSPSESSTVVGNIDSGQQFSCVMYEMAPADTNWAAGTSVVRINFSVANMQMTMEAVYLCQRSSACAAKSTYGSATGLAIGLGTSGVQTVNVTCSAITALASDLLYCVVELAASAGMGQTVEVTPDQNIDTPIGDVIADNAYLAHHVRRLKKARNLRM